MTWLFKDQLLKIKLKISGKIQPVRSLKRFELHPSEYLLPCAQFLLTRISPERFTQLAEEIVKIFPNKEDVGTYYTAYKRRNGVPCNAHGKLLDRHQYVRKCLKEDGILCEISTNEVSDKLGRNIVPMSDGNFC